MPLSCQQLVTLACQIAKVPGYTSQAGQLLNMSLQELCQDYDLEVCKGITQFYLSTAGIGPNALPTDWLRAKRNDVFYTNAGTKYFLINQANEDFDALVVTAGLANFPVDYTVYFDSTGVLGPQMYVWPPPSSSFQVTARYYRQMPDYTTPETNQSVPWFPNTKYLLQRLAGELMQLSDDERAPMFLGSGDDDNEASAAAILKRYLKMEGDQEDRVKVVTLDRRRFGNSFNRLPNTKKIGF